MAWMVYLIMVTSRTITKAYDPYEILGISRVRDVVLTLRLAGNVRLTAGLV